MNPTQKDYTRFEKKLTNILNSSARAKEWSDLLPLIQEILNHLNDVFKANHCWFSL